MSNQSDSNKKKKPVDFVFYKPKPSSQKKKTTESSSVQRSPFQPIQGPQVYSNQLVQQQQGQPLYPIQSVHPHPNYAPQSIYPGYPPIYPVYSPIYPVYSQIYPGCSQIYPVYSHPTQNENQHIVSTSRINDASPLQQGQPLYPIQSVHPNPNYAPQSIYSGYSHPTQTATQHIVSTSRINDASVPPKVANPNRINTSDNTSGQISSNMNKFSYRPTPSWIYKNNYLASTNINSSTNSTTTNQLIVPNQVNGDDFRKEDNENLETDENLETEEEEQHSEADDYIRFPGLPPCKKMRTHNPEKRNTIKEMREYAETLESVHCESTRKCWENAHKKYCDWFFSIQDKPQPSPYPLTIELMKYFLTSMRRAGIYIESLRKYSNDLLNYQAIVLKMPEPENLMLWRENIGKIIKGIRKNTAPDPKKDKRPSKPDVERRLLSRYAPKDKPKTPFLSPHRNIVKARESDTVKEIDERIETEDDPEQKKILKKARDNAIQQSLAKQKLEAFRSLSSDEQTRLLTTVNTSYKRTLDELNLIILKHNYKDERRPITKEKAEKYFSGDADKVLELQKKMRENKHQSSITIGKHILNERRA